MPLHFTVPSRHRESFTAIAAVPLATRESVLAVLAGCGPVQALIGLVPSIVERAGITVSAAEQLVRALSSAYVARIQRDVGVEEFAAELTRQLSLPHDQSDPFTEFLTAVLRLDATFGVAAKLNHVESIARHTLCGTPVMAVDARPVFKEGSELAPAAVLILHSLEFSYHDGDDVREVHLALTTDELDEFERVLRRARQKERALENLLATTGAQVARRGRK